MSEGMTASGLRVAAAIPAYQAAPSVGEVVRGTLAQLSEVLGDKGAIEDALSRLGGEPRAVVRRTPLTPPYVRSLIAVSAGGDLRTLRDDEIVQP